MLARIRLWYWWNFTIQRNEFSSKLDIRHPINRCQTAGQTVVLTTKRRHIAHLLDVGSSIVDIPVEAIKQARI